MKKTAALLVIGLACLSMSMVAGCAFTPPTSPESFTTFATPTPTPYPGDGIQERNI